MMKTMEKRKNLKFLASLVHFMNLKKYSKCPIIMKNLTATEVTTRQTVAITAWIHHGAQVQHGIIGAALHLKDLQHSQGLLNACLVQ